MPNAIETQALCKDFGKFHAVTDLKIAIKSGCFCGFIGKNGAQVKVKFQKFFEWLGFIFDWEDL